MNIYVECSFLSSYYVLSFLKVERFKREKNGTFVQIKSTKTKCFIILTLHCIYDNNLGSQSVH